MKICIDSVALGTQESLVVNSDGSCQWQNVPEDCSVHLGSGPGVSIFDLAKLLGVDISSLAISDAAHDRSFEALGVKDQLVPWAMVLGRRKFTARLKQVVQAIQDITGDPELVRYVETYRQGNEFLKTLQRPRIDVDRMRQRRSELTGGVSPLTALASFSPDEAGLAPEIEYDRVSTATGRLKVARGPSVLTLQKECRDIITSRRGGSVWEVDFVSLEPRVALNIMGVEPPRDIYEGVRERMNMSGVTRSAIKQAVISALYGSSSSALAEALGGRREAQGLIREVKVYFKVADLVARLRSEMDQAGGRLHNYYGRPLLDAKGDDPDSKLISHYLQSTAVDVALLGFKDLSARLSASGVQPIYVIHDAVLFDVPAGREAQLQEECSRGVDLEIGRFELGLKRVSQ